MTTTERTQYLLASDFDQTLSFNDSGAVLAELIGVPDFERRVQGLSDSNLVQQGGELAYLIRHDPDFRGVRREHLRAAGERVRLKQAIPELLALLENGIDGARIAFRVISAAPREVVVAALDGIVPAEHIVATELDFDAETAEVAAIHHVAAGFGKVAALELLSAELGIALDRVIYVGDGSSDVHAMLHVNHHQGFTVAVSGNRLLARVALATVISDNACSVLMPILEQVFGWRVPAIRAMLERSGLRVDAWEKVRMETVKLAEIGRTQARERIA
ncbi:MAG TPA: HAD family hydrolase [Woeseiaceae bacterium]|nr:HAD family hydrolase [Woeseiaceae bacterium]